MADFDEAHPKTNPIAVDSGGMKVSWGLGFVGCLAAFLCIAGAIIAPILQSAGSSTETKQCMGNLRRLAAASFQYAQDNDGKLPGEAWHKALAKQEPDEVTFACPHQRRIDPRSSGYALNRMLAWKPLDKIEAPGTTALFFDSKPTAPGVLADPAELPQPPRHRNGKVNNVAFADGRVDSIAP